MPKSPNKQRTAFTLVEIMVVVAIIGLLAALALPAFAKARKKSITQKCIQNMRVIEASCARYEMDHGTTLYSIRNNGVAIRNLLIADDYITHQHPFDCPSSQVKDYDDYRLLYVNGRDFAGITCTILPAEHILP